MLRTLSTVDQGLVEVANSLLVQLHVPIHVESLEDINTNVFVTLFEGLYGEPLPELLPNPQTKQDEIHNCQIVIDTLANKILHTSLSHITGKDIIEGDRTSVANLLEILTGLLEFLTEKIDCENSRDEEQEEEVFHDQAFLGNQDDIDQLMEGIKNLPSFQNAANCETSNENGSVKAAWQDFKNSENSKTLAPEYDLLVGPVKADNDFHNLTFSILSSSIEPPPSPPVTSPKPLSQEDKDINIDSSLPQMDLAELRPQPVTTSLDEITAKNDNRKMQKKKKETGTSKVLHSHIAHWPRKNVSNDTKEVPSQSSKGQHQSKANISIKLPRHEEEKTSDSPSSEAKEFSPEEVTELLKTYSNKRTTDDLLDMIDVTLRQLEAETKPSTSPQRVSQKKQVHFEEPSCIKKVRKIKVPVSMWHHKQGDWKKNKKLKFVRRNYAEDLAELHKDVKLKAKAEKTAANEKEKELLKTTGEHIKFTNTAKKKKKTRKPNMNARVYTTTKEVKGEDLLPALLEEFPHLQLSMETWHELWRKSIIQLEHLTRSYRNSRRKRDQTQQQIDDAEKRQHILYDIIKKELSHAERMKEMKESKKQRVALKNRLHEKRMTSARARKYYNEFSAQMRSRMMSKKTKEELIFKRLFQDSLQIQREHIQELQKYLHEIRKHRAYQLQNEIDSMENFYHDQFQIVSENMKHQRTQKMAQEAAQTQLINKMKQDLRKKMEQEVRNIQEQLCQDEDEVYFRELDAERVKRELQLANYVFTLQPRSYLWNSGN